MDISIRENKKVRNFVLFFGFILAISIILSIIFNYIGYLYIYFLIFRFYSRKLDFHEDLKNDFKKIVNILDNVDINVFSVPVYNKGGNRIVGVLFAAYETRRFRKIIELNTATA